MVRNTENSEERPDDKKATSLPACEVVVLFVVTLDEEVVDLSSRIQNF